MSSVTLRVIRVRQGGLHVYSLVAEPVLWRFWADKRQKGMPTRHRYVDHDGGIHDLFRHHSNVIRRTHVCHDWRAASSSAAHRIKDSSSLHLAIA